MDRDLEIYIHIPFCVGKCNYCDFLSFPADASVRENYIDKLREELVAWAPEYGGRDVSSVYIGGGTPSLLQAGLVGRLMDTLHEHYHILPDAEISIEANPASALRHKFAEYIASGINRLSLGLQSADDRELRLLGRRHSYAEFLKAYESARKEGFGNINVDLISHIPTETLSGMRKTLRSVLLLKPEHISVYSLTVEPGTPFYELNEKGLLALPDEDTVSAVDESVDELMSRAGYSRYEFSNFSRPGYECRHNIGYWAGAEYLGAGLGASSYIAGRRWKNTSCMSDYMAIDFGSPAQAAEALRCEERTLSREDEMEEFMFLGLRLTRGVSRSEFKSRFGSVMENIFGAPLTRYTSLGLMRLTGDRYSLTDRGRDISNYILADFLIDPAP